MSIRFSLALLSALLSASSAWAGSTINPNSPAQNSNLTSAPLRQNFNAAYTDINNILTMFAGSTAPASPSVGQNWRDTSVTPSIVRVYDGAQWVAFYTFDTSTHTITPVSGGSSTLAVGTTPITGGAASRALTDNGGHLTETQFSATNLPSTLVQRDGSGNFAAGIITASGLTGLTSLSAATLTGTTSVTSASYLGTGVDTANTASTVVKRDASGNFAAGAITAASILTSSFASSNYIGGTGPTSSTGLQGSTQINSSFTATVGASFTGSQSGTNLTTSGTVGFITAGDVVLGGAVVGETIVSQSSGVTGGNGVYVVSGSGSASTSMTAYSTSLRVSAVSVGVLHVGDAIRTLSTAGVPVAITGLGTGTGGTGTYTLSAPQNSPTSAGMVGSPNDVVTVKTGNATRMQANSIGGIYYNSPTDPGLSASTFAIHLNPIGLSSFMGFEGVTPTMVTVDQTGIGGGDSTSHSSNWTTVAYNSAGVRMDAALKLNPGFSYSHAGHEQSDLDMLGYFDGKGSVGTIAFATGCTTTGNGTGIGACTTNQNAAFYPVPDAINGFVPANGGVIGAQTITTAADSGVGSGHKVLLTMAATGNYTTGMSCQVTGVNGTVEANGTHIDSCTVVDGTHIRLEDVLFAHAFTSSPSALFTIVNQIDLGAPSRTWGDLHMGGNNLNQGVGSLFSAAVPGYRVFAQASENTVNGLGTIFEQYQGNLPAFIVQTNSTGTVLGSLLAGGPLTFFTANALRFVMSATGGFGVNTLTDPGAGNVNITGVYQKGGSAGLSFTATMRDAGGAADCTIIFSGGIVTGGTC